MLNAANTPGSGNPLPRNSKINNVATINKQRNHQKLKQNGVYTKTLRKQRPDYGMWPKFAATKLLKGCDNSGDTCFVRKSNVE